MAILVYSRLITEEVNLVVTVLVFYGLYISGRSSFLEPLSLSVNVCFVSINNNQTTYHGATLLTIRYYGRFSYSYNPWCSCQGMEGIVCIRLLIGIVRPLIRIEHVGNLPHSYISVFKSGGKIRGLPLLCD